MAASDLQKRWGLIMGLRGLLMLLAGLYAVIWPAAALAVLVIAGGAILLIDGVLGLWALTFGGAKTGNFWFDVVRNILAIITGVLILLSPVLATLVTVWFFIYLVAFQAIVVGVMEIVIAIRERANMPRICRCCWRGRSTSCSAWCCCSRRCRARSSSSSSAA